MALNTTTAASGLSPRGRGNRGHRPAPADRPWSIPAWAGKPLAALTAFRVIRTVTRTVTPEGIVGITFQPKHF